MSLFGSFWKKGYGKTPRFTSSGEWRVGDKIANRFEILKILGGEGKSGMGIVYICYDLKHKLPCLFALKTFQKKYLISEEFQKLFKKEALVWTELGRHPYIVQAVWVEELENRLFIILEYIPLDPQSRNNLSHYLGNLTLPDILKFSIQFCYGMEYAHSKGIDAHRDIKPDNIMIAPDKTIMITDFGLTKAFQGIELKEDPVSSEKISGLSIFQTKAGKRVCGTLPYMAPEQFDGYADKRSDIYSFGITLYQMVTGGKLPFVAGSVEEYERLHKNGQTPLISSPLSSVIQRCLEKNPDKRFQDFITLREELQRLLLEKTGEKITPPENENLSADEWVNKGAAFTTLGQYKQAICCYDEALEIDPSLATSWNNKGEALHRLGKLNEAINCFDKAIEIDAKCAEAWNGKGVILVGLNKFNEAINCFDKAIEINPEYADAWYDKGFALAKAGNPPREAIFYFDKALELNPKFIDAWNNKAAGLFVLGRFQEALRCIDEVLKLDPNFSQAREFRQLILQSLGG